MIYVLDPFCLPDVLERSWVDRSTDMIKAPSRDDLAYPARPIVPPLLL